MKTIETVKTVKTAHKSRNHSESVSFLLRREAERRVNPRAVYFCELDMRRSNPRLFVIARSAATKQSRNPRLSGLLRRYAPRNDDGAKNSFLQKKLTILTHLMYNHKTAIKSNQKNHSSDSSSNHVNQNNHTKIMSEPLIYVIIMIFMIFCHVQANHVNHKNHIKICGSDNVSNQKNLSSDNYFIKTI